MYKAEDAGRNRVSLPPSADPSRTSHHRRSTSARNPRHFKALRHTVVRVSKNCMDALRQVAARLRHDIQET